MMCLMISSGIYMHTVTLICVSVIANNFVLCVHICLWENIAERRVSELWLSHQTRDLKLFSFSLSVDCFNFFLFLFAVLGSNTGLCIQQANTFFLKHCLYSLLLFTSFEELKFLILVVPFTNFFFMDCVLGACFEFYLHKKHYWCPRDGVFKDGHWVIRVTLNQYDLVLF